MVTCDDSSDIGVITFFTADSCLNQKGIFRNKKNGDLDRSVLNFDVQHTEKFTELVIPPFSQELSVELVPAFVTDSHS